jgi:hypothetical protein
MIALGNHRTFAWTALVAATYSLVICGLLIWDAAQRLAKPPLDEPAFVALKQQLTKHPDDAQARQALRELDIQLRGQFFHQQQFTQVGVYLLLGGVMVTLVAARRAAVLHRRIPRPSLPSAAQDPEEPIRRWGVAAVGAIVLGVAATIVLLHVTTPTLLPDDGDLRRPATTTSDAEEN